MLQGGLIKFLSIAAVQEFRICPSYLLITPIPPKERGVGRCLDRDVCTKGNWKQAWDENKETVLPVEELQS